MPKYPLLPLPIPESADPPSRNFFPRNTQRTPQIERQGQRLGSKFERLANALDRADGTLSLRSDPSSIAPERALVLEVAGSMEDFLTLVRKIEGLEFLADEDFMFEPDEDFFKEDKKGQPRKDKPVDGRLYLAMPDVKALRQLVSLWRYWQDGKEAEFGFAQWWKLFERLRNIRPWGLIDRISAEVLEFWKEDIEVDPTATRCIEVELWFRDTKESRAAAFHRVAAAVVEANGTIIDHVVIEEISYEAMLVDLPSSEISRLIAREEIHLAICDDVMFLRPQSSVDVSEFSDEMESISSDLMEPPSDLHPIAALLDGVPVQNHQLLDGRLHIDDPDNLEAMSIVARRCHGTAMASLILHGDRNDPSNFPISRKIHMRPVLYASADNHHEEPRRDRLLVDVIYQAVKRMKDGDQEGEATAPDVFLVNLSLGDHRRPFTGLMSPWARLLDYLAEHYGILFLVSAGNVKEPLWIDGFDSWPEFEDASEDDREREVLLALSDQKIFRTLLSPAEALNPITVGAMHDDAVVGPRSVGAVDPYKAREIPNVSSALGLGHRKVVKPDIHLPGGREHLRFKVSGGGLVAAPEGPEGRSGLRSAWPDEAGNVNRTGLTMGTSAATALATRSAHLIFDALMDGDGGSMHMDLDPEFYAVTVKALLVHRAKWGEYADFLDTIYGPHGQGKYVERRDNVARLLGYGFPDIDQVLACAPNRATLLGHGIIVAGHANIHRIPLPQSLEQVTEPRALTVTVAWFSPVNPKHQAYRRAKLEVGSVQKLDTVVGVKRSKGQPSDKSIPRGTIYHAHYEGAKAVPFVDNGYVLLRVVCREQGGSLDQSIGYGIAVTIEAGEGVPVYQEVRQRLAVLVGDQIGGDL